MVELLLTPKELGEKLLALEAYERRVWLSLDSLLVLMAAITKITGMAVYLGIVIVVIILVVPKVSQETKRKKINLMGNNILHLPNEMEGLMRQLTKRHTLIRFWLALALAAVYFVPSPFAYPGLVILGGAGFFLELTHKKTSQEMINKLCQGLEKIAKSKAGIL
ncbi:MAG: hypothetical protein WC528_05625 [Patescibacteria group bacterium]